MNAVTPEAFAARSYDFKGFGNTRVLIGLDFGAHGKG
jgi:hypothetical protein